MPPTLRIHLLGEFRLAIGDQPVFTLTLPRLQALLAYLALNRHAPQPRRQLAFSFWPDSTERQAHTNLRKLIYQLRQALPEADGYLVSSQHTIGLHPDVDLVLDVADLESALAALARPESTGVAAVEQVIALYQGELLPACYEEWLLSARRALHERVVNGLTAALPVLEAQREVLAAVRCAEHLLRLDPLHEAPYRHLMHLRALAGDLAGAVRAYHACVTVLAQELDVPPSAETQALYEHLLRLEPQQTQGPAIRTQQAPLVGRKREWQMLRELWSTSGRGAQLAVIWGEAGVGKTRLVDEVVHWAQLRPGSVARTRAYAAESALAYAPLGAWLRSAALRQSVRRLDPIWQTEIARLLPELLAEQPGLAPPAPLLEGWQRQRFHEALARVVLAGAPPRLLVLDDLQWCDGETLGWLGYLLRVAGQASLLILGTARTEAVDEHHPLREMLHHLRRDGQVQEFELAPLTPTETAELAGHLTRRGVAPWGEQLYQETEGNPLFVVETIRAWLGGRDERLDPVGAPPPVFSPTVQAVIASRLAQLSPQAQQLAQVAATIGRSFTADLLEAASGVEEEALVHGLDELWQRRIVREQGTDYDFCHDKIREVAYGRMSHARQRLLHRRIGEAMERLHHTHLEEVAGKLAAHFEQAGLAGKAAGYWLQAGARALDAYAARQAERAYTRALALAELPAQRAEACLGLGRAYFALDRFAEALASAQDGLNLLDDADPHFPKLLYLMAEASFAAYDVDGCGAHAQAALRAAEAVGDHETICQSLSLLGQVYSTRGDLDPEVQLIARALQICRQTNNRWREGRTLADLGWLQAQRGEFTDAIASAEAALACLATGDDRSGIAFASNVLGRGHGGCGNYAKAFAAFAESYAAAEAIDHKFLMAQVPNMRGWLHQQLCDYARALALDEEGAAFAEQWQKVPAEISARINVALDRLHLGEPLQALGDLVQIQQRIEREAFGFHAWRWRLRLLHGQGLCHLALAHPEEALALAEPGYALAKWTSSRKYLAENEALQGLALADLGRQDEARTALAHAVDVADQIGYKPLRWGGRWHLSRLHAHAGDSATAQAYLREAACIIHAIADGLDDAVLRTAFLGAEPVQIICRAAQPAESNQTN